MYINIHNVRIPTLREGCVRYVNTVFTLQKLRTVTVLEPFHGTVPVPFTLFVVNQNHACAEKYGRGKNGRGRRSARTLILKL